MSINNYLKIFKALGDKTRLRIVIMLTIKSMCVCEIREIIGFSMSTISNHLKILKEAGIIDSQKEEKYVNYKLNTSNKIMQEVLPILCNLDDDEIQLDKQKALKVNRIRIC